MKKSLWPLLAGAAVFVAGCIVTSVEPFYTSKDLTFDPALVGNWTNAKEAGERWKFEIGATNAYRLTYTDDKKSSVMLARLFKLEGESFLDLFTTEEKDDAQPPPIPAHSLLRVFQITPNLRMAMLNYEWLAEVLTQDPKALRHHIIKSEDESDKGRLVLTASTSELQDFIRKHLKTEEAWKDAFELNLDVSPAKTEGRTNDLHSAK